MLSSPPLSPSFLPNPTLTVPLNPPPTLLHPRTRSRCSAAATASRSTTFNPEQTSSRNFTPQGTMTSISSLYEVLGIHVGASSEEIKAAYRRLARVCHPDVAAMNRKDSAGDEFMKIHAAYSTLSDPDKRAVYDSKLLFRRRRPLTSSTAGSSGYRGRSWESDQCW